MRSRAFEVRKAGMADAESAFHLIDEYYAEIGVVVRDSHAELEHYRTAKQSGIWLAWVDGHDGLEISRGRIAIGCILLRPLPQLEHAGEIKRLYVRQAYRGTGVAQAMLLALEDYAAAQGIGSLYLDTKQDLKAAIQFYERSGYGHCERYNDNPQATIFMRKQLH